MATKQRLSIVASYDDLTRNRNVLISAIEPEMLTLVLNFEEYRKQWAIEKDNFLSNIKILNDEKMKLETCLKHARNQLQLELTKRQAFEEDNINLTRQLNTIKELLSDANATNAWTEERRERLLSLSMAAPKGYRYDYQNHTLECSSSSPDLSYDKTEEEVLMEEEAKIMLTNSIPRRPKRPSAPPVESDITPPPPFKKSNLKIPKEAKKHRRSKSVDTVTIEITAPILVDEYYRNIPTKTPQKKRSSSPFNRVRSSSQSKQYEPTTSGWSPEMRRMNSGGSLTRPHNFENHTSFKQQSCFVCSKKIKFTKIFMKCKDCRIVCHIECREDAPLPCVTCVCTPNPSIANQYTLNDLAPVEPPFIPAIVIHCVNEIEDRGFKELGIYRVPGGEGQVKELKNQFLKGPMPKLSSTNDIHVVCGCLKDFFRGLKEPLVTYQLWHDFVKAAERKDRHECTSEMMQVISHLPKANRDTLAYLIVHLQRVAECAECKMPIDNLVKVFGPTIVRYSNDNPSPENVLFETGKQQIVMDRLMMLPSDYWKRFLMTENSFTDSYRSSNKYESPQPTQPSTRNAPLSMYNEPVSIAQVPNSYESVGWFTQSGSQNGKVANFNNLYTKKPTQFFAPPTYK